MIFHRTVSVAITGASGAQYALRLVEQLLAADCRVYLMVSSAARVVVNTETDIELPEVFEAQWEKWLQVFNASREQLCMFSKEDWFSPVASGSSSPSSLVVCPASGGTISAIAHGASNNLIERAADVALKERRQLILVPREMPLSDVHLENMLKLSRMGAVIMPASPGFYQNPETVSDLVDFVVARILDQLGVAQKILPRWGE
ncbi:MAG: UbiX family flavin prenyltransferase [Agarilytica sp.]